MLLKTLQQDGLLVHLYKDRTSMGQAAADAAVRAMEEILRAKESINVVFAAAPSQNEVLAGIALSGLDFGRINAFHLDEYLGLAPNAPQRFSHYLQQHIFGKVSFRSVNLLGGGAVSDPQAECQRYAELLHQFPVDVSLVGIGENGHIAFNDPHVADFHDPADVKVVELDDACRMQQVHDGCFAGLDDVPKQALTMTIPAILQARQVICAVPGENKADALNATINGEISETCPATALRRSSNCILFCDTGSGRDLL